MKQNKNIFRKAGILSGIILTIVVSGLLLTMQVTQPFVENKIIVMENRQSTLVVGDADPGDASGFFYAMIYPHQADATTAYVLNLSNDSAAGGAYEFSDSTNTSMTNETPFSTTFDIVIKVGATDDDVYDSDNNTLMHDWLWCLLTSTGDLSIGANTNMTEHFIGNTTSYAWYQYSLNNSGSGYTITEGQSFNLSAVKFYVQRVV